MIRHILLVIFTISITGCAKSKYGGALALCDPDISEVGPDTYYATGNCREPHYTLDRSKVFCERQGKKFLLMEADRDDIMFHCLKESDPRYKL